MASAYVPPPPPEDDDFLLDSQPQGFNDPVQFAGPSKLHQNFTFGGDGFLDASGSLAVDIDDRGLVRGRTVPLFGAESVQQVPETPALRNHRLDVQIPHTDQRRLDFSFSTPSGPDRRGHIGLRPISEIPEKYRFIFKGFLYFNLVQSKVFDDVMYTDYPLVASAPTGSGKTVIFELAIIRLLMQVADHNISSIKIVYVAPMKALCSERYEDWQAKFSPLGLRCCELTGDSQLDDYFELQNAQIVMTTPEKWDSMTRKWRDHKSLVQMVRLFLIDEVHQLNDECRGPTMEAIVSRMKTVRASVSLKGNRNGEGREEKRDFGVLRFIAISATMPNISDIAAWLGSEEQPALEYFIDESHRPVRLRRVVLSYPDANSDFKFDLSLNYRISNVIQCYSDHKPTLVFCATRKGTQQAASTLVKDARFVMNSEHKQRLQRTAGSLRDSKLRDLVLYGVGYHHAGLDSCDRKTIEAMFTAGDLPVLFATSTLAMGVNLPAHLVIIKSTMHYVGGMFQEYSESQILQMIGRAGRPQFDTTATAVIMTRNFTKSKYEALLGGTQFIESHLHRNLIEHLNAEIVLNTIFNVSIALEWLKSTFLYCRVKQNPKHYGIPEKREQRDEKLQELCLKDLNLLEANSLIKMDDGFTLQPTDTGRAMARYCVAFESMKRFLNLKGNETLGELVRELSLCKECEDVHLRVNEKRVLNTLNKDKNRPSIRFPMSGKIKSTDMKVNCLIQAALGCLPVQEFALNQDTQKIFRSVSRLTKCLMELQILGDNFNLLLNSVIFHKCIQAKLWENSKHVARQIDKIGLTLSTTLVNAGLTTFDKIQATNPRELELIMNRHPPFGNQIRDAVSKLPRYSIQVEQSTAFTGQQAELTVSVVLLNHALLREVGSTAGPLHTSMLLVGDSENNVVFRQRVSDSNLMITGMVTRRVTVHRVSKSDQLFIHFISLEYVGLDVQEVFIPRYSNGPPKLRQYPQAKPTVCQNSSPTHFENSERPPSSSRQFRKSCNHKCINKEVCGHDCCRNGILVKDSSKSSVPQSSGTPMPSTTIRGQPTVSSALPRNTPKRNHSSMGSFMNELHARTSCIPETPALKRLKPSSSSFCGSTSSSSSLSNRFSYAPKKMSLAEIGRPKGPQYMPPPVSDHVCYSQYFTSDTPRERPSCSNYQGACDKKSAPSIPPPTHRDCSDDYDDFDFPPKDSVDSDETEPPSLSSHFTSTTTASQHGNSRHKSQHAAQPNYSFKTQTVPNPSSSVSVLRKPTTQAMDAGASGIETGNVGSTYQSSHGSISSGLEFDDWSFGDDSSFELDEQDSALLKAKEFPSIQLLQSLKNLPSSSFLDEIFTPRALSSTNANSQPKQTPASPTSNERKRAASPLEKKHGSKSSFHFSGTRHTPTAEQLLPQPSPTTVSADTAIPTATATGRVTTQPHKPKGLYPGLPGAMIHTSSSTFSQCSRNQSTGITSEPLITKPSPKSINSQPTEACSFFTAGLISHQDEQEDESQLFGSVFAGIF